MKLYEVPLNLLPDIWPAASAHLNRALKHHPFMDEESLLTILMNGNASLIIAVEESRLIGAAVMEVYQFPKALIGNVLALAGDRGIYQHMDEITDFLESWCRSRGCAKITELGRPGWSRLARRRGYETKPYLSAWKDL